MGVLFAIRAVRDPAPSSRVEMGNPELGFWVIGAEGESAVVWKDILADLKERGLEEPLLFIGDGLKGLGQVVKEIYPLADFQSCILHKVRSSLSKVRKKHRDAVAEDMQKIYRQRG